MKTLKSLAKQARTLNKKIVKEIPRQVSRVWLWTAQNAFLTETDPATGSKWEPRHGLAFGKGFKKSGNIEPYLSYRKLHRTGMLLRSLKTKRVGNQVILYSNVPYAQTQNEGGFDPRYKKLKGENVQGGVSGVVLGGKIHARPFMTPSGRVLEAYRKLTEAEMVSYGWKR